MKVKIVFKNEESKNYYISLLDAHNKAYRKNDETNTIYLTCIDVSVTSETVLLGAHVNIYMLECFNLVVYIEDTQKIDFMVKG